MPNEILFFLLSRESFEERLLKLRLFKFEVLRNSRARLNFSSQNLFAFSFLFIARNHFTVTLLEIKEQALSVFHCFPQSSIAVFSD